ncbi:glycosyltransferase [Hyphomicrobium sp. CS1BSMeth3]|uniref:glycosyltransferase n=1 Tax=Hyphomicrobium sp. CS1BSMeth3 TaxID=1892844 RepID=UPI001160A51C|nr:glycosyltransferase [Hyphomicrobium sp. CS1BSMeth3]
MMRIALTADPEIPVPPRHYGGIERIVDMLARALVERGQEVTLFSHPASECPVPRVAWPGADSFSTSDTVRNAATLARHVMAGRFDIVHSFSRIAYMMPILPFPVPKIMTYQRAITPRSVKLGHTLSRGTLAFTAISEWMMRDVAGIGRWYVVPNGVPLDTYTFVPHVSERAPLVFLGRVEEIKGPHLAIEIARRAGCPLVIAGNIPDEHRAWAEAHVLAHVDGEAVRYIGSVDDAQKNALLGAAAAMLMPIVWDEPFGIVMAEAMACGTPVLGLRRGAVPEVVEDGITGFVRDDVDGLVAAVHQLSDIDRANCRARVAQLYSAEAVVEGYLGVYRSVIGVGKKAVGEQCASA